MAQDQPVDATTFSWYHVHTGSAHDGILTWKRFCITGLLWGESTGYRWIALTEGQWCRTLMNFLMFAYRDCWTNCRCTSDLRCHDIIVPQSQYWVNFLIIINSPEWNKRLHGLIDSRSNAENRVLLVSTAPADGLTLFVSWAPAQIVMGKFGIRIHNIPKQQLKDNHLNVSLILTCFKACLLSSCFTLWHKIS